MSEVPSGLNLLHAAGRGGVVAELEELLDHDPLARVAQVQRIVVRRLCESGSRSVNSYEGRGGRPRRCKLPRRIEPIKRSKQMEHGGGGDHKLVEKIFGPDASPYLCLFVWSLFVLFDFALREDS